MLDSSSSFDSCIDKSTLHTHTPMKRSIYVCLRIHMKLSYSRKCNETVAAEIRKNFELSDKELSRVEGNRSNVSPSIAEKTFVRTTRTWNTGAAQRSFAVNFPWCNKFSCLLLSLQTTNRGAGGLETGKESQTTISAHGSMHLSTPSPGVDGKEEEYLRASSGATSSRSGNRVSTGRRK